jgi:hypothetical protein
MGLVGQSSVGGSAAPDGPDGRAPLAVVLGGPRVGVSIGGKVTGSAIVR